MPPAAAVLFLFAVNQTPAQPLPTFEVSSVKPSRPGGPSASSLDAAHLSASAVTLLGLIMSAWRVPAWRLLGGPAWMSGELWDVAATLPPGMPADRDELTHEADLMLQALIADRFKLTIHRDTREQAGYALVVAKTGSKLRPSPPAHSASESDGGISNFTMFRCRVSFHICTPHKPRDRNPRIALFST